jgi:hypothetical protein
MVVDELVGDEFLRIRFVVDRLETVAELVLRGFDLDQDEIDLFCTIDARCFFVPGIGPEPRDAQGDDDRYRYACDWRDAGNEGDLFH